MNASLRSKNKNDFAVSSNRRESTKNNSRNLLPALVALGGSCGFVCGSAAALELGDIEVQSTLGQPLRASIAFALNPNEAVHDYCIYLNSGLAANGLPSVNHASIAISNGTIRLTGNKVIKEPLLSLQLTVDCPYAANLSRQYSVFVNPQLPVESVPVPETARNPLPSTTVTRKDNGAETRSIMPVRSANRTPIANSGTYRVQQGDTLSGIAERVSGRSVGIWQAVDVIFAANPDAFLNNDKDLLKAGALLVIPGTLQAAGSNAGEQPSVIADTADTRASSARQSPGISPYAGYTSVAADRESAHADDGDATAASTDPQLPVNAGISSRDTNPAAASAATEIPRAPRAGDISLGADGPFVAPIESTSATAGNASPFKRATEVIPPTSIEVPATAETPAAIRGNVAGNTASNSRSWTLWLGGSGIALILGLLLFGRKFRDRFGTDGAAISDEAARGRRRTDGDGQDLQADDAPPEVDFRFDEPIAGARVIALDGDLDAGTGFQDSGDIDVAQDFGFSASGDFQMGLDIEFSAEPVVRLDEETMDIARMNRRVTDTKLVSDVSAGHDDETSEYDLSMIVDATQQPTEVTDETTKDLKAIELDPDDATLADEDPYTLSNEVDYKILELDYEEELTATQALSAELAQAARELSAKLNADVDGSAASESPTGKFATLGADLTAELLQPQDDERTIERAVERPADAENLDLSDLDDTGVNEEVTTGMPAAENDAMVDIDIESATIDTKKMKVS